MKDHFVKDFHLLTTEKGPVVYHLPTHRFFSVDEKSANIIWSLEKSISGDIDPAVSPADVEEVRRLLFKGVGDSTLAFKQNILGNRPPLSIFYLFVSQDCNLNCTYCYGDGGDYQKGKMMMSDEVADHFMEKFITGESKNYMINFFGGEPLMNLPLMKRIIATLKEKSERLGFHVTYNINTNGTMWSQKIKEFLLNEIQGITVSLDGPKEINDIQRVPVGKFSPHDQTVRMLEGLKERGKNYLVRTVVTKNSYDRLGEIYKYNMGLSAGSIGLTLGDVDPSNPVAMTDEEYRVMTEGLVKNNVENLLACAANEESHFYDFTYDLLELMFFKKYRPRPCNAGNSLAAVAADGDIYPCHRFVGFKEFCVGNVKDAPPLNGSFESTFKGFREASVDSMDPCSSCWGRYLCGGSCYVISYLREGSITTPPSNYCHLKKTVYHSLLTHFIEIMSDPPRKEMLMANVKKVLSSKKEATC